MTDSIKIQWISGYQYSIDIVVDTVAKFCVEMQCRLAVNSRIVIASLGLARNLFPKNHIYSEYNCLSIHKVINCMEFTTSRAVHIFRDIYTPLPIDGLNSSDSSRRCLSGYWTKNGHNISRPSAHIICNSVEIDRDPRIHPVATGQ